MDSSPPPSLVVAVVGVMEVRYDPNQVLEGRVHKVHYFHLVVSNRDSLVGHVVVFIFERIVHKRMVDRLWLIDFNWHKFSVITMVGLAILISVVFYIYPELKLGRGGVVQRGCGGRGGRGTPAVGAPPTATPPLTIEVAMVARIE
jgi:hypothetical protein